MQRMMRKLIRYCWPPASIARLLLVMLGLTGCEEAPPIVLLDQSVGASPLKSPPFLVSGSTEQRFLAVFDNNLYVWNLEGQRVGARQRLPFSVNEIFPTNTGALAVGREGFIAIDMNGTTQAAFGFEHDPERIYWAVAVGKEEIFVTSAGLQHDITVKVYHLDGHRIGPPFHFVRPKFGTILAASRLGDENYVLVWEEDRSLYAEILSKEGQRVREPFLLYSVGKGGALQRGSTQRREDGSVLVAWQDSSPGPWSVMALIIKPDGAVEIIGRVNPQESTDATRVSIPRGANGRAVAWVSGTHWGKFAVSGQGRVLVQAVYAHSPAYLFQASGSVQSFSMAMRNARALVLGSVRQTTAEDHTLGYNVYAGFVSFPQ